MQKINDPSRLIFEKKDYAYLWNLFNDVRTITSCFILAEGYLSFWLSDWSHPSFHLFTRLLSHHSHCLPPPPNCLLESWRLGSLAQKGPDLFSCRVTTFSRVAQHIHIRPPLSTSLSLYFSLTSLSITSLSPMDICILRMLDVWATPCWKWYVHCPPVVEMDFE